MTLADKTSNERFLMELALSLGKTKHELMESLDYPGGAVELVEWRALFSVHAAEEKAAQAQNK